jgi:hypothetical protein
LCLHRVHSKEGEGSDLTPSNQNSSFSHAPRLRVGRTARSEPSRSYRVEEPDLYIHNAMQLFVCCLLGYKSEAGLSEAWDFARRCVPAGSDSSVLGSLFIHD